MGGIRQRSGVLEREAIRLVPTRRLTYTYDAENRLTGTVGVAYTYDGDGKRVQKSTRKLYWYTSAAFTAGGMESNLPPLLTNRARVGQLEHCMRRRSVIYYRPAGKPKWKSRINAKPESMPWRNREKIWNLHGRAFLINSARPVPCSV